MENLRNWAGNYEYKAARLHNPQNVRELQEIVAGSSKVRLLGTRHSFNDIADTEGDLVSMEAFNRIESIDQESMTVTVGGGITYGKLAPSLDRAGFAIHNLASLPHISVAGAVATATHGSGVANGNLATIVAGLEIVKADGSIVNLSEDDNELKGAVVGLGALGAVTKIKLRLIPSFNVRQNVFERLSFSDLFTNFDAVMGGAYSVSLFTDWKGPVVNQVWVKSLANGETPVQSDTLFGATAATRPLHPLPGMPADNCTEQMGVAGPWSERLAHFRMDFTPSSGEELQSEYYIPYSRAKEGMQAVLGLSDRIAPLLHISEVRTIAADDLWMSPCYREACIAIHFTWKQNWEAVQSVLPLIDERLKGLNARPHWGKLFTMSPESIRARYEKLSDFQTLANIYDPTRKFRNAYLNSLLG